MAPNVGDVVKVSLPFLRSWLIGEPDMGKLNGFWGLVRTRDPITGDCWVDLPAVDTCLTFRDTELKVLAKASRK